MKNIFSILSLIVAIVAHGQSTRSFEVEDFKSLKISGPFEVVLLKGSSNSVELSGDQKVIDGTTIKIERNRLVVEFERNSWKGSVDRTKVRITFDQLEELIVGGACELESDDKLVSSNLSLGVNGASKVNLEVQSQELVAEISGASSIRISGRVENQSIEISGASSYRASELDSNQAIIKGSGASNATISVKEALRADLSGATSVYYYGNPNVMDANTSGASSVKRRN
ncbi:MAG: DUF2807 domain-containing protein [Cyclobacteriaceae bacterium]